MSRRFTSECVGASVIVALASFFSLNANAGWNLPGTEVCLGLGCGGKPIIGSEWVKQRWEEMGQGPESVAKICRQVGPSKCTDPTFVQIYQILRAGQIARMYNDTDGCVATGLSLSEGGHRATSYIALAKGVAIPKEYLDFSAKKHADHITGACEVLFPQRFSQDNLAYVGEGVYSKKGRDAEAIKKALKEGKSAPVGNTSSQSCTEFWDEPNMQCLRLKPSLNSCPRDFTYSRRLGSCYQILGKGSGARDGCSTKGGWWDKDFGGQCLKLRGICPGGYNWSSRLRKCYQKA